jgi:type I restriction enzyme R subunit
MVRTFGDDELKEAFAALELPKISQMISEVQHHIDNINQKEAFASDDATKQLVNEAMMDISFNFSKIGEEEMKLISGGVELKEKWESVIKNFTQNVDQDDPEFVTLREVFMRRFKEHGFVIHSISEFEEHSKALDEVLKKLNELQKRNKVLLNKYNGDAKFARVHKRIREENKQRQNQGKKPIVSEYDESIMSVLLSIKSDIDKKVYDRNDILKKDAYFEKTVMTQIKEGMNKLNISSDREDRQFIQSRITKQYLDQYHDTYPAA